MQNLIETWLAAEASIGNSQADAIRQMNKILDCRYTSSRINEWRRGDRYPDSTAHRYIVMQSIVYAMLHTMPAAYKALEKEGDPIGKLWRLVKALSL